MDIPPGLAEHHFLMLRVAHLANRGHAILVNLSDLTRGQPYLRVIGVARHEGRRAASGTDHLSAASWHQLDVVNGQSDWNAGKRQGISNIWRGPSAPGERTTPPVSTIAA